MECVNSLYNLAYPLRLFAHFLIERMLNVPFNDTIKGVLEIGEVVEQNTRKHYADVSSYGNVIVWRWE